MSNASNILTSNTPILLRLLQQGDEQLTGDVETAPICNQKETLEKELDFVIKDNQTSIAILSLVFTEKIPRTPQFYARLNEFLSTVGWSTQAEEAVGCIWSASSEFLTIEELETLLRVLPSIEGHPFFRILRSLPHFVSRVDLRPEFAAEWLPSLMRRIGNDLASDVFWNSLGTLCEKHPVTAIGTLNCLFGSDDESNVAIAAYLLGTLRAISRREKAPEEISHLESKYLTSSNPHMRSVYRRSWVQTVQRGQMSLADLQKLAEHFQLRVPEGQHEAFWIVCRALLIPTLPPESRDYCLKWLKSNASGDIAPEAKYCVIDCVAQHVESNSLELLDLVVNIQPIPEENGGSWERLEFLLVSLQNHNLNVFKEFFIELAEVNARGLYSVLQKPRSYEWLVGELHNKDLSDVVCDLCFSADRHCRKLGLFLFDKLQMTSFPDALLEKFSEEEVYLTLYEFQRTHMNGGATANFLISLLPRIQLAGKALQDDFYDELVLQAKNYSGLCLEEFERKAADFPLLQKVTEAVYSYFEMLKNAHASSICAMDVPGYRLARRNYARRFNNEVSKGAEEMSVFSQLCKKVRLLYGRSWRTFMEGSLGESSDLKQYSNSIEMPRMEIIDPEGMACRRLHASAQIEALSKGIVLETEA